ncbi:MFS transporter [Cupriavidus sp. 2SB]|uniref:MFS transporter n=1 Tax=Cupriavidus sp. 2SB TaxID=2502199 RepID=UPI0010F8C8BB|nr:MFS transporter [Cupriavidus sp. 2SB]
MTAPGNFPLAAYGALGLPLAMAALPIYVQAPAYYTTRLGMSLSLAGVVMFAARLIDTAQDPLLGRWIDKLVPRGRLLPAMWLGAILLGVAFAALWLPPVSGDTWLALWLAGALVMVYIGHSLLNVAYLAWGARLANDKPTLTRAAAWREGAGLVGVLLASALPAWLLSAPDAVPRTAMTIFAMLFAMLLICALWMLIRFSPTWRGVSCPTPMPWRTLMANHAFRALLLPYFLNGLSIAIAATLAVFFIEDRLGEPRAVAPSLTLYFLAGAVGLPGWVWIAGRLGAIQTWRIAMLPAVLAFVWAGLLGPGDTLPFLIICALSGLSLGADLALPPVLLAERIPASEGPAAYYGVWTLLGKLCLAIAGLTLPILAALGYQPGALATGSGGLALAWMYAGVPCLLKLCAMASLTACRRASPEVSS